MKKFLISLMMFFIFTISAWAEESLILPSQLGIVQEIDFLDSNKSELGALQLVKIKLLDKKNKNEIIQLENVLTGNPYYDIKLKKGAKVILHVEEQEGVLNYSIEDLYRLNILLALTLIFAFLLIFVGRKKGINSLISIGIICFLSIKVLSPMILLGINPIVATILICFLSTLITLYLVGGFNRKSTAATIGCILSLIIAAILAILSVKFANLTGFSNEHSMFLYSAHPELDFVSICVSIIILATMGAVMDVAISIASTINEIYTIDPSKTVKELFASGMNVGKDIIGTMANTLILVYIGSSLPLILLASNIDIQKFLNLNQVFTEISSAIIGSSAIVICVPITAIVASFMIKNSPNKIDFSSLKD